MTFQLLTSGVFYPEKRATKLAKLGFHFECDGCDPKCPNRLTGPMPTIEVATLDELVAFVGKWGQVIVTGDSIEIYDDYRE